MSHLIDNCTRNALSFPYDIDMMSHISVDPFSFNSARFAHGAMRSFSAATVLIRLEKDTVTIIMIMKPLA